MPRERGSVRASVALAPRIIVATGMARTGVTRVATELQACLPHMDVVDAGACWADIAEACAPGFARMLVVTTHDVVAISAAYALVKMVRDRRPEAAVEVLVNRSGERDALRTYERIQVAASHFLGETVAYAGAIPDGEEPNDEGSAADGAERDVREALRALAARLDGEMETMAGRVARRAIERRR